MKYSISYLSVMIASIFLSDGCGYTQPHRTPPIVPRGNVIQIFPSQYFVDVLDSTESQGKFIVIDTVAASEDHAIKVAWSRDADAFMNVINKTWREHHLVMDGPDYYTDENIFSGTMIKYYKNIIPCDSPIVSILFSKSFWVSATVTKYPGEIVNKFDDEKMECYELAAQELEPGIYEIHIRAGENPLWTHRGLQWETSRWIEIVK